MPAAALPALDSANYSPLSPPLPGPDQRLQWGRLYGAGAALALAPAAQAHPGLLVAVVDDVQAAARLGAELALAPVAREFWKERPPPPAES